MPGTKRDAEAFAKRWAGRGDENQETQLFWIDLFQNVLGLDDALERLRFEVPVVTDSGSKHAGYIDVLIPSASALVEQKSVNIDLDRPEERQGRIVAPAEQGRGYAVGLPLSQQPRYVITCNFQTFRVYDRERDALCVAPPLLEINLSDLPKNLAALQFLNGAGEAPSSVARAVSVEAGRIMGQIHEQIAPLYHDPNSEASHHALSVLCTRIMFLMFCEDAGLIEPGLFQRFIAANDAVHLRRALLDLFRWLDTPDTARGDEYPDELLARFPYMDGGLFREEVPVPQLTESVRYEILVSGCQEFDWSGVDPTVFGSIFEGALSHDARRAGGMHYTSPENIHKVIDPLFLDDLEAELDGILEKRNPSARTRALNAFHERLGGLTFLDPACGSGNFLTESYLCLRRLEDRVLMALQKDGQTSLAFEEVAESPVKVTLANFHGIEINDFACCVARTALWIAEKQADINTAKVVQRIYDELPLKEYDTVRQGNALRMDWNDVVPAEKCDYVMGNPPFVGYSNLSAEQKADRADIFGKAGGTLDYVTCWYKKAVEFMCGTHIRAAFVSTNSICQGQQVEPLWKPLFDDGVHIDFAHRTFVWNSQASDEAHVHVIIVGFSREQVAPKLLFDAGGNSVKVRNINAYLAPAADAFIVRRAKPLCDVPPMVRGCQPTDNGLLLLSQSERDELVALEPQAEHWIRPFSMGAEFINGIPRYCLWLVDASPADVKAMPLVMERVKAVREYRLQSTKAATRKKAETPWLFDEVRPPKGESYIAVPAVSSGRRRYIPLGFVNNGMIPGNKLYYADKAGLYEFGIMSSHVHNAWTRVVSGRLKSDFNYSNTIVYNNFVWPEPTDAQHAEVERFAQAVLDARKLYEGSTLADMYNPDNEFLYPELMRAHQALDAAVEAAYGVDFNGDEERIVAHLFKLYAERTQ